MGILPTKGNCPGRRLYIPSLAKANENGNITAILPQVKKWLRPVQYDVSKAICTDQKDNMLAKLFVNQPVNLKEIFITVSTCMVTTKIVHVPIVVDIVCKSFMSIPLVPLVSTSAPYGIKNNTKLVTNPRNRLQFVRWIVTNSCPKSWVRQICKKLWPSRLQITFTENFCV